LVVLVSTGDYALGSGFAGDAWLNVLVAANGCKFINVLLVKPGQIVGSVSVTRYY
jgi:hypothetical protein